MIFRRRRHELGATLAQMRTELDTLRIALQQRDADLQTMKTSLAGVTARLSTFDERLTQMASTLTNQFYELDAEIQKLAATSDAATAERVEQLRTSQTRLASEQARYAIAFRQDLAELAELLRRVR
jgi:predicted  nucleic acid-binding Zn-ribbon protein